MTVRTVLQLLGPSTGGIRKHVAELSLRTAGFGWRSTVAGPAGVSAGLVDDALVVPVPAAWNPFALRRARRALASPAAAVDVVHAHGLKAASVALALGRRRPPVVLTVHNLVQGTHDGAVATALAALQRAIVRRVDHVILLSEESLELLGPLVPPTRRTVVMPFAPRPVPHRPPDEVRAAYGIDATAPLVVVAARHHPQKDLPMFLEAFASVRRSLPGARAILVGDGPERSNVERERRRLGLDDAVILAGQRPDPIDEMNAADVVAVPSRWEAGPLVSVECLQLGRPLVTTAVGSVVEHLTDGRHARIVATGDSASFAGALLDVLTDPGTAAAMGAAGHRLAAERFDPEALVGPVIAAYEAALGTPRRSRRGPHRLFQR